jgi:hypothetical protein
MSIVISASSAKALSEITAAVAAVVLVFSEASMLNLVDRTEVPASLMSTITVDPVGAVVTLALTAVNVIANGIRNVTTPVPVARSVVSSEQATPITSD